MDKTTTQASAPTAVNRREFLSRGLKAVPVIAVLASVGSYAMGQPLAAGTSSSLTPSGMQPRDLVLNGQVKFNERQKVSGFSELLNPTSVWFRTDFSDQIVCEINFLKTSFNRPLEIELALLDGRGQALARQKKRFDPAEFFKPVRQPTASMVVATPVPAPVFSFAFTLPTHPDVKLGKRASDFLAGRKIPLEIGKYSITVRPASEMPAGSQVR